MLQKDGGDQARSDRDATQSMATSKRAPVQGKNPIGAWHNNINSFTTLGIILFIGVNIFQILYEIVLTIIFVTSNEVKIGYTTNVVALFCLLGASLVIAIANNCCCSR